MTPYTVVVKSVTPRDCGVTQRNNRNLDSKIKMARNEEVSTLLGSRFPNNVQPANDKNHGSDLLKGLLTMYQDGRYSDVSLKIGHQRTLRAHRVILASFTPYFEALLGDNWEEGRKDELEIRGLDEDAVSSLIKFAYCGSIEINKDNVQIFEKQGPYNPVVRPSASVHVLPL